MIPNKSKKTIFDYSSRIVTTQQLSSHGFIHEYEAPEIAYKAQPGQFVQIRVNTEFTPFLRRPFSILEIDKNRGTFFILFKVFGEGTSLLASKKAGDYVKVLGPLGNSFRVKSYNKVFLIAGGIGIPPIYFLLNSINYRQYEIRVFFGATTKGELLLADNICKLNIPVLFSTDDGSFGAKGFVTDLLENDLHDTDNKNGAVLAACGPLPMLSAVQKLAKKYSIPAQLSVESIMACGFGVCQGCVLPNTPETGGYSLVCKDGPVFTEKDVKL